MQDKDIYIAFGSNQGDSIGIIEKAKALVAEKIGEVVKMSSNYETEPWGFQADSNFVNAVGLFRSNKDADQIMKILLSIENQLGRLRTDSSNYESRKIDLDIIAVGEEIIKSELVEIPHPRMHLRAFVLVPFKEVSENWVHPSEKQSITAMIDGLADASAVNRILS